MSDTVKKVIIGTIFDGAGFDAFQKESTRTREAAAALGIQCAETAKIIDQTISHSLDNAGNKVKTVTSILEENGQRWRVSFQQIGNETVKGSASMQTLGAAVGGLGGKFTELISRALPTIVVWSLMRGAMMALEEVFSSSVKFMIEWETEMAKIQIVTGATKEQVTILSDQLLNLSEKFGINSKDVAESANEWLRMGANMSNVIPLLDQTAKLSLISGKSMEESAKSINILRSAFSMNAKEVGDAIDKLIGIQSASGVSLEVLLEGFDKASIKAHQMGTSFNQLAGYIAAVNQRSRQSGEAIGTQLNMMFNRLGTNAVQLAQNLSGVPFYLDSVGKATSQTTSQMRNTNEILSDLAANWNKLSNTQQNALAKTLGSARQVTTFISLMENFNEAVKASSTPAGESQKDIATVLDTTNEKIKQLQTSWDRFVNSPSVVTGMKATLDFLRNTVDALTHKFNQAQRAAERFFLEVALVSNPKQAKDLGIDVTKPSTTKEDNKNLDRILDEQRKSDDKKFAAEQAANDAATGASSSDQTKTVSGLQTEQQLKESLQAIEEKGLETHQDKIEMLNQELALIGDGITADGKNESALIASITLKKQQLELERQKLTADAAEADIEAKMSAEGASQLEVDIQHLAYLQEHKRTAEEISKQQEKVDLAGITQYKQVQDDIISAIVSENKLIGENKLAQLETRISLQDQLGIHLEGVNLLKQQLELYEAIADQTKKTPGQRDKELAELIHNQPHRQNNFGNNFAETERENRLTNQARSHGIDQKTIDAILHPEKASGGQGSLQDELKKGLTNPLGSSINRLSSVIAQLADSISGRRTGSTTSTSTPGGSTPGGFDPLAEGAGQFFIPQGASNYSGPGGTASRGQEPKSVTLDIGGIHIGFTAHNKKELGEEVKKEITELIQAHLLKPGTKISEATKKLIDNF